MKLLVVSCFNGSSAMEYASASKLDEKFMRVGAYRSMKTTSVSGGPSSVVGGHYQGRNYDITA
jgi:hypothetical protein